jgi:hypothetical protein
MRSGVEATFQSLVGRSSSNPWLPIRVYASDGSNWAPSFREAGLGTYNDFTPITNYNIVNNWTNITFTADASRNISFYLNGALRQTQTLLTSSQMQITRVMGGYQSGLNEYSLQGSMSSAKFYNTVLSATEVTQNYNAQKSRFGLI